MLPDRRRLLRPARLAAVLLLLASVATCEETRRRRLLLANEDHPTFIERSVAEAVRGASVKLESARCRAVFSDFRDGRGRTLAEVLADLGESPESYLHLITFYEGSGLSWCADHDALAKTMIGSRAVFICGARFEEERRRVPGLAAAVIIHEELHSLGLGENPPTSTEITFAVLARCGR